MIQYIVVGLAILIGFIIIMVIVFSGPTIHFDLERRAELLYLSHDADEIKAFLDAKMNYLTEPSWRKLLSRIEELQSDKVVYDELLGQRIDSLEKNELTNNKA